MPVFLEPERGNSESIVQISTSMNSRPRAAIESS
jgi:hypothetical protein